MTARAGPVSLGARLPRAILRLAPGLVIAGALAVGPTTERAADARPAEAPAASPAAVDPGAGGAGRGVSLVPVGGMGGPARAVATDGRLAYVGAGAQLEVVDLADPAAPRTVGRSAPLGGEPVAIAVAGSAAYVAVDGFGLEIVDVGDPTRPRRAGALPIEGAFVFDAGRPTIDLQVVGAVAYVAVGTRLVVLDVAEVFSPAVVFVTELGMPVSGVAVDGDRAVVSLLFGPLVVFDVSDRRAPRFVAETFDFRSSRGVALRGDRAFVATDEGLSIVDLTLPDGPGEIAFVGNDVPARGERELRPVRSVALAGDYAYAATDRGVGIVFVVDIRQPEAPQVVAAHDTPAGALDLALAGPLLLVAEGDAGVELADVSEPAAPRTVGRTLVPQPDRGLAVEHGRAYVAARSGLLVADLADPTNPRVVGVASLPGTVTHVAVKGARAYVTTRGEAQGLRILDVADPVRPHVLGFFPTPVGAERVVVDGTTAYLLAGPGLRIVDVADPARPRELGAFRTQSFPAAVAVAGAHVYVAGSGVDLEVVDVSDPGAPRTAATFDLAQNAASDVAVVGDVAYLSTMSSGLVLVDVRDPMAPRLLAATRDGNVDTVTVSGGRAYLTIVESVCCRLAGGFRPTSLRVVDVANPYAPRTLASLRGQAGPVPAGEHLYATDAAGGLAVVRVLEGPRIYLPWAARRAEDEL